MAFITQPVESFQTLHSDRDTVSVVPFTARVTLDHVCALLSVKRREQKISTGMLCNILGVLVQVGVGKRAMAFELRHCTSRFQEINGRRNLTMNQSSDESQGIHTTVILINLDLYVHKLDDKFWGRGKVLPSNQVSVPVSIWS